MQSILQSVQKHLSMLTGKSEALLMLRKTKNAAEWGVHQDDSDTLPFLSQLRDLDLYDKNGLDSIHVNGHCKKKKERLELFGDSSSAFFTGPQFCPSLLNSTLPHIRDALLETVLKDARYAGASFRVVPLPLALLDKEDSPEQRFFTYGRWTARTLGTFPSLQFAAGFDEDDMEDYLVYHFWENISLPRIFWASIPLTGQNPLEVLDVDDRVYLFCVLYKPFFSRKALRKRENPDQADYYAHVSKSSEVPLDCFYTLNSKKLSRRKEFPCHTYYESLCPMFRDLSLIHSVEALVKLSSEELRSMRRDKLAQHVLNIRNCCATEALCALREPFEARTVASWKQPSAGQLIPSFRPVRIGSSRDACSTLYAVTSEEGCVDAESLGKTMLGYGREPAFLFDTITRAGRIRYDIDELTPDVLTMLTIGLTNTFQPAQHFPFVQRLGSGMEPVPLARTKRRTEPVYIQPAALKKKRLPVEDAISVQPAATSGEAAAVQPTESSVSTEDVQKDSFSSEDAIPKDAIPKDAIPKDAVPKDVAAKEDVQKDSFSSEDAASKDAAPQGEKRDDIGCATQELIIVAPTETKESKDDLKEAQDQVRTGNEFQVHLLNKFTDMQLVKAEDSFSNLSKVPEPLKPLRIDCPTFRKQYNETRMHVYSMKTFEGKAMEMETAKKELKRWILLFGNMTDKQRELFEDEQRALHKDLRLDENYYAGKLYGEADGSWWYHVSSKVLFNPNPWVSLAFAGPHELYRYMRYKPTSTSNTWEHHVPNPTTSAPPDLSLWESHSRYRIFNATMLQYIQRFA